MAKYISKLINGEDLYYLKDSEARENKADKSSTVSTVSYDATNKKITKTINGVTSDVVTAETLVTDGGAAIEPEVEIGGTTPTGTPKLFVDEDSDPLGVLDVYTKQQTDNKLNTLTRRTRLTDFDLSVLKLAVAEQNLEKYGLKVGDQKTINGHTYVIAGLNCMKGSYSYTATANHVGLIVIPHTTHAWNASGNTYTGADERGAGYLNSDLHYYLKNTVLPLAQTDLGASNLITHKKLLSSAVNTTGHNRFGSATGCSSSWTWSDELISALSEMQVYGGTIWSSSGYDTGEANQQLEVFKHYKHTDIFGNQHVWLRDVASASGAPRASYNGAAGIDAASGAYYVAGLILFH